MGPKAKKGKGKKGKPKKGKGKKDKKPKKGKKDKKPKKGKKDKKDKKKKGKKAKKGGFMGKCQDELFGSGKLERILRLVMAVVCVVVVVIGIVIIIRARYMDYMTKSYREFCDNRYETIFTYFILIGSIGLVVGVVGAVMALGGSRLTLVMVLILFVLALVGQLVLMFIIAYQKKLAQRTIHASVALATRIYYGQKVSHADIDFMHEEMACCGYVDHNDYLPSNCRPDTCCKSQDYLGCAGDSFDLFKIGCREEVDRQIAMGQKEYLIEFFILAIAEIVVIVLAVLVGIAVKKKK